MKVALLSDCYPPRLGGIETQVQGLAGALVRAGNEVEVFTITPGASDDAWPVHRLGLPRELPGGLLFNPAAAGLLRKALRAGGFDVVHTHLGVVGPFAMDAVRIALGVGVPVAATWHSVTGRSEVLVRALGYPARWARRGVALSAVSRVAAAPLERAAGAQVAVVPNGIDTSFWCVGERSADQDRLHVVSAMRFAGRKRPAQLIEMVGEARRRSGREIRLTVAGDGPLWERLNSGPPQWCSLPGRLTPLALRDLYRSADVYAAPTVLEAFGIAAAEARCCGLPIVTRAQSAVADLVEHERTGLLAPDDDEFVTALARIAVDPALHERLSAYSRQMRLDLGWPDVVRTVLAEYRRAQSGG